LELEDFFGSFRLVFVQLRNPAAGVAGRVLSPPRPFTVETPG